MGPAPRPCPAVSPGVPSVRPSRGVGPALLRASGCASFPESSAAQRAEDGAAEGEEAEAGLLEAEAARSSGAVGGAVMERQVSRAAAAHSGAVPARSRAPSALRVLPRLSGSLGGQPWSPGGVKPSPALRSAAFVMKTRALLS